MVAEVVLVCASAGGGAVGAAAGAPGGAVDVGVVVFPHNFVWGSCF